MTVAAAILLAVSTKSFATSGTLDAYSEDITDYNAFVTAVANAVPELASLEGTWNVMISTPIVDARDNTNTNPLVDLGVSI